MRKNAKKKTKNVDPFSKIFFFTRKQLQPPAPIPNWKTQQNYRQKKSWMGNFANQKKDVGIYTKKNEIQRFNHVWPKMNGEMFGTLIFWFKKKTIWAHVSMWQILGRLFRRYFVTRSMSQVQWMMPILWIKLIQHLDLYNSRYTNGKPGQVYVENGWKWDAANVAAATWGVI